MWKRRDVCASLLKSCHRRQFAIRNWNIALHSRVSLLGKTEFNAANGSYKRYFSAIPNTVATNDAVMSGMEIDEEVVQERPELFAVPLPPKRLSISTDNIGTKPMSLEDFRKKISKFQNEDNWRRFKTDEGVIENERADILADRINDLLSNRKQKFIYKVLQKFIMLPSPIDHQSLLHMLRDMDKGLDAVSPSLLPWIEAYFSGADFPESGEDLREVQLQIGLLTKVTERFYKDWENVQYDGFQWRVNVVRDCIESYVTDDESMKLYAYLGALSQQAKAITFNAFLIKIGSLLKYNEHCSDLLALVEWVIKGLNDFPLISISAIQSNEVRKRDAERHILISAYNKYRYHSKSFIQNDVESEKGALLLSFRLSTLLDDTQSKLFVHELESFQNSAMEEKDVELFVRSGCQICGQSAYLIEPSLRQYAKLLSIPTIEHVRRMKKPVLTVKAVSRYCHPGADVEAMLREDMLQEREKREAVVEPIEDSQKTVSGTPVALADEAGKKLKKRRSVFRFQSSSTSPPVAPASPYQVFVHNLPVGISTEELAHAFRNCGTVSKVEVLDYSNPKEEKTKKVIKIRQTVSESKTYGFVHFEGQEALDRALIPAMRIFGIHIGSSLCRTEPAENKRTLFIGNIERGITGEEVSESLNAILEPHLSIELQNLMYPGIITTSTGYCFIEFDSHQLASLSFSLLSGAIINGRPLKVGWALDSNDGRKRKSDYRWEKYHI